MNFDQSEGGVLSGFNLLVVYAAAAGFVATAWRLRGARSMELSKLIRAADEVWAFVSRFRLP